jgi:hypothetical protein
MTEEAINTQSKEDRIIYLYCVTNLINNKVYIGQTICPNKRWSQHKSHSKNPKAPFQFAIKKYGFDNFKFEIIACCKGQENANHAETLLVEQYDSLITNNYGYNATYGGMNAPKTEAWKESFKNWRESLSKEEKRAIRDKQSAATIQQIQDKGHPAQGHKWTDSQREGLSKWRKSLDKESIYTPELRKKMSESHKGKSLPREQVEKIIRSNKIIWEKKKEIRYLNEDIRCHADGCNIKGQAKYKIINNIRYCNKHGLRMLRTGQLELQPKKPIVMTDDIKNKISKSKIGKNLFRTPHNKIELTQDQINIIITDSRSIIKLSKELNIGRKVISRIRKQYNK